MCTGEPFENGYWHMRLKREATPYDSSIIKTDFDRIYSDDSLNPAQRLGQAIAAISDQFCRETGGTHADYVELVRTHLGGRA